MSDLHPPLEKAKGKSWREQEPWWGFPVMLFGATSILFGGFWLLTWLFGPIGLLVALFMFMVIGAANA
jgi:hypothetical protein